MEVIRARVLGFCMGVHRAVKLATAEADNKGLSGQVYTLGPLIHNPKVLSDLKNRGIEILDEPFPNLKNCSVIIRAHGIEPHIENDLRGKGANIVDATCPKVKESQLKVKALAEAGFSLFLAGDAAHAEIAGLIGYADKKFRAVVSSTAEAETAAKDLHKNEKNIKLALVGQTTFSSEEYQKIGEAVKKYFPDLEIVKTICTATQDRQQALRELFGRIEAVIIAGGKESANTRRLFEIARESGLPCVLIEKTAEIPEYFRNFNTVGLSAGASTPDTVIDEITAFLNMA
jgi:4-hydroxy-3-methylbut-2-enyl diphosphate reductase